MNGVMLRLVIVVKPTCKNWPTVLKALKTFQSLVLSGRSTRVPTGIVLAIRERIVKTLTSVNQITQDLCNRLKKKYVIA